MSKQDQFRFVSLLALELQNGDIVLPSLPDVVMKIRQMLESETAGFDQVSQAVSLDPVLVSLGLLQSRQCKSGITGNRHQPTGP